MRLIDQILLTCSVLVLLTTTPGCADSGFGDFDGTVVGDESCLGDVLPFESSFQTGQEQTIGSSFYFQSSSGIPNDEDYVFIALREEDAPVLGQSYALEPPGVEGSTRIAQLIVGRSCPDALVSYYVVGNTTFTAYEPENGGEVTGTISGTLIDEASGDVVVENFEGAWDFTFEKGPPYELFP